MAIILLVAIFTVHVPNGFSSIKLLSVDAAGAHFGQPGYETPLLYLAALISLVLGGSGPLAFDRFLLGPRRRQWRGTGGISACQNRIVTLKNRKLSFRQTREEVVNPLVKRNGRCGIALSPLLTRRERRWP
jgi:hypothetical protein